MGGHLDMRSIDILLPPRLNTLENGVKSTFDP
jgi:hypothetical protein